MTTQIKPTNQHFIVSVSSSGGPPIFQASLYIKHSGIPATFTTVRSRTVRRRSVLDMSCAQISILGGPTGWGGGSRPSSQGESGSNREIRPEKERGRTRESSARRTTHPSLPLASLRLCQSLCASFRHVKFSSCLWR